MRRIFITNIQTGVFTHNPGRQENEKKSGDDSALCYRYNVNGKTGNPRIVTIIVVVKSIS